MVVHMVHVYVAGLYRIPPGSPAPASEVCCKLAAKSGDAGRSLHGRHAPVQRPHTWAYSTSTEPVQVYDAQGLKSPIRS